MTNKEMYAMLSEIVIATESVSAEVKAELLEKMAHNVEMLDRKGTSPRKPSATQMENANLRGKIAEYLLECGERKQIKEIAEVLSEVPTESPITPNRVSALMSALVKEGSVARIKEGKATYFVAL